jgi:hypothetical protein
MEYKQGLMHCKFPCTSVCGQSKCVAWVLGCSRKPSKLQLVVSPATTIFLHLVKPNDQQGDDATVLLAVDNFFEVLSARVLSRTSGTSMWLLPLGPAASPCKSSLLSRLSLWDDSTQASGVCVDEVLYLCPLRRYSNGSGRGGGPCGKICLWPFELKLSIDNSRHPCISVLPQYPFVTFVLVGTLTCRRSFAW